jgi:hypothetical protein
MVALWGPGRFIDAPVNSSLLHAALCRGLAGLRHNLVVSKAGPLNLTQPILDEPIKKNDE